MMNQIKTGYRYIQFEKDGNGRSVCPKCWNSYKQRSHLIRHLRYECGVDPKFKCTHCPRRFKQKSKLLTHVKSHYLDTQSS
ncbi:PREDICTED: zinc finger protein 775-like [Nicrophorus vespilloides]|uniref:Zinc finger protein 775-like n=1 Tax=Nicrophorus vespilloides TaxID=110193 RepID=A0ABM1N9L2_NICVS|nr:PREDICTED: zinc finger protein 775-like [Nicrophorus vespilloides]